MCLSWWVDKNEHKARGGHVRKEGKGGDTAPMALAGPYVVQVIRALLRSDIVRARSAGAA